MQTKISARHMEVTEAMRSYVDKKMSRLSKYYNRISEIEVVFDAEGTRFLSEIIVNTDHHQPFVVTEKGDDMYACLDLALDKIERQLVKHKEKSRSHKGQAGAAQMTAEILEAQADKEA